MNSEEKTKEGNKNPKRVAAGRKGVEAKKLKAVLKRKEVELLKKENIELKQITKDSDDSEDSKLEIKDDNDFQTQKINVYKNYMPLCLSIGVIGLGYYFFKIDKTENKSVSYDEKKDVSKIKKYDPFEF